MDAKLRQFVKLLGKSSTVFSVNGSIKGAGLNFPMENVSLVKQVLVDVGLDVLEDEMVPLGDVNAE